MTRNASDRARRAVGAGTLAVTLLAAAAAWPGAASAQGESKALLTATVGPDKVLLRWAVPAGRFEEFTLLRQEQGEPRPSPLHPGTLGPLTDADAVRAVFKEAGEEAILDDITTVLGEEYQDEILRLRGSNLPADRTRLALLANTNYGVAIVEGRGFLDRQVAPGRSYAYELWGEGGTAGRELLGTVEILAGQATELPAPGQLEWVPLEGASGSAKVFLRWQGLPPPTPGAANPEVGFGFDVYRQRGRPSPPGRVITDLDIRAGGGIEKVNRLPVLLLPSPIAEAGRLLFAAHCAGCHATRSDPRILGKTALRNAPASPAHQGLAADLDLGAVLAYVNDFVLLDGEGVSLASPVAAGGEVTYWVVARDLLRQHGRFSTPVTARVRDTLAPKVPGNVEAEVVGAVPQQRLRVRWDRNASDAQAATDPRRYVDDTASYRIYRRFGSAQSPREVRQVGTVAQPADPAAGSLSFTDASIAEADWGKLYWYHVTAVDAAGNESPFSGPAKGVVHDLVPPGEPECVAFCDVKPTDRSCRRLYRPDPSGDPRFLARLQVVRVGDPAAPRGPVSVCRRPPGSDVAGVKVYRSLDGLDFHLVEDLHFTGEDGVVADELPVADAGYRPRVSQRLTYRYKAFDENTNLGPATVAALPVVLAGDPPPAPQIVGIEAVAPHPVGEEGWVIGEVAFTVLNPDAVVGFRLLSDDDPDDGVGPYPHANDAGDRRLPFPAAQWALAEPGEVPFPEPRASALTPAALGAAGLGPLRYAGGRFILRVPLVAGRFYAVTAWDVAGQESAALFHFWPGPELQTQAADRELEWPRRPDAETFGLQLDADPGRGLLCLSWGASVRVDLGYVVFRALGGPASPDRFVQVSPFLLGNQFFDPRHGGTARWCDGDTVAGEAYSYSVLGIGFDGEVALSLGPATATAP